ncbi:hypothetical protein MMYC01_200187 [Madurella mycetomatis]|uniref:Uncharacterized protein n=1 Tax=Madurella mycetomatis TaxID=100816 RepID=A0A175VY05_9PEZI|nr:hypothetical protein MMYC01_206813 [Madurella mycetomatis]KXX83248.1 hypothetical protein MMYC01_200187 [Madurella mycetomatis]
MLRFRLHHCSVEFTTDADTKETIQTRYALSMQDLTKPMWWYTALSYTWGQQIPLMSRIYQYALNTVIWLGEGSPESDSAVRLLQDVNCRLRFINTVIDPADFEGSSFHRSSPRDDGNSTCGISPWLYEKFSPLSNNTEPGWRCWDVVESTVALNDMRSEYKSSADHPMLFDLLVFTRHAQCYDPRDKTYGLLGPRQTASLGHSTTSWVVYNACGPFGPFNRDPEPEIFHIDKEHGWELCARGVVVDTLAETSQVSTKSELTYTEPAAGNRTLIAAADFVRQVSQRIQSGDTDVFDTF